MSENVVRVQGVEEPEKLDLRSHDIAEDKRQELLRLFPEIRTEGGKIDFDQLKRVLGETVDPGRERYGMTWPGKADCFKTIQRPSMGTLLPCREESVNFDTTENLIIEGDNLEVLKLLQKAYLGKVKMIYIDPPYNTGNEFIYPDNYAESLQTYLEYTGQVDSEGRKFSTNTEADGRFHSNWLNMMYPRLYLARNLLRDDGVIFVSIDDNELSSLRMLMNELFGEECFVSLIVVQANKRGQTYKEIAKTHEFILVFSKTPDITLNELDKDADALPFKDSVGPYDLWELRNRNPKFGRHNRPNLFFPIYVAPSVLDENGLSKVSLDRSDTHLIEVWPKNSDGEDSCWRWGTDKIRSEDLTGSCPVVVARKKRDGGWNIYERSRKSTTKAKSLWTESEVISEQGTVELGELGLADYFEHPKPIGLIKKCLRVGSDDGDIVLDFFAGSGTTAHAVGELAREMAGVRQFILVQLPEPTNIPEFPTIAHLTRERWIRAGRRLTEMSSSQGSLPLTPSLDVGFRSFALAESNLRPWPSTVPGRSEGALATQMELHVDHVRTGRTAEDILFEVLIKSGFPLTTPIGREIIEGKTVYSIANGAMLICLDKNLTPEALKAMAERKPQRVICLDDGFAGNDQLKTNAVQTMKAKGVTSFRTV